MHPFSCLTNFQGVLIGIPTHAMYGCNVLFRADPRHRHSGKRRLSKGTVEFRRRQHVSGSRLQFTPTVWAASVDVLGCARFSTRRTAAFQSRPASGHGGTGSLRRSPRAHGAMLNDMTNYMFVKVFVKV